VSRPVLVELDGEGGNELPTTEHDERTAESAIRWAPSAGEAKRSRRWRPAIAEPAKGIFRKSTIPNGQTAGRVSG